MADQDEQQSTTELPNEAAQKRIVELRRQIEDDNYRYYVLDDPALTDAEYDARFQELRALEAQHPKLITPDSPTQRVSSTVQSDFAKIKNDVRQNSNFKILKIGCLSSIALILFLTCAFLIIIYIDHNPSLLEPFPDYPNKISFNYAKALPNTAGSFSCGYL